MPKPTRKSKQKQHKIPIILDVETGDCDDILTIALAVTHPRVDVQAITVTPGSLNQIRLIQFILTEIGGPKLIRKIRFGAQDWPQNRNKKGCVNVRQYSKILDVKEKDLESFPVQDESQIIQAAELIIETCQINATTTLFTGGPLHNLGKALQIDGNFLLHRWVAQGGFCGDGVVPDHVATLKEFVGCTHYSTWNFGGSIESTNVALQSERISRRVLIGKNVCHRCIYNASMDNAIVDTVADVSTYLPEKVQALRLFQKICKNGKKLHDPLAFATLVNENVCDLMEVIVTSNEQNKWGSIPALDLKTNTFAAVDFSFDEFLATVLE